MKRGKPEILEIVQTEKLFFIVYSKMTPLTHCKSEVCVSSAFVNTVFTVTSKSDSGAISMQSLCANKIFLTSQANKLPAIMDSSVLAQVIW